MAHILRQSVIFVGSSFLILITLPIWICAIIGMVWQWANKEEKQV